MPLIVVASAVLAFLSGIAAGQQQGCPLGTALNEEAFRSLAEGGVAPRRMKQLIDQCGLRIRVPEGATLDQQLRGLGATPDLLRDLAPPENAAPQQLWVSPVDHREMVFVPGGTFAMGSPASEAGRDADEVLHNVTLRGYWLDRREVSNAAFRVFTEVHPEYLKAWTRSTFSPDNAESPATGIPWRAARAYCRWSGERLPTEAEWEYAARSGNAGPYWWGSAFDRTRVAPIPATATQETPWHLIAMLGGVWEWTSSLMKPYPYDPSDGREDPASTAARVVRGGFWNSGEQFLRSANRSSADADAANDDVGFRCAR